MQDPSALVLDPEQKQTTAPIRIRVTKAVVDLWIEPEPREPPPEEKPWCADFTKWLCRMVYQCFCCACCLCTCCKRHPRRRRRSRLADERALDDGSGVGEAGCEGQEGEEAEPKDCCCAWATKCLQWLCCCVCSDDRVKPDREGEESEETETEEECCT